MYKQDDLKIRRRTWLKLSGIPEHAANSVGWLLSDCIDLDEDTARSVKSWVNHVKNRRVIRASGEKLCGKGVMIFGDPGFGKTTVASAMLQEMITSFMMDSFDAPNSVLVRPVYFASFNNLISLKGEIISNEAHDSDEKLFQGVMGDCKDDAYNIRVLVIDDIGKEHMSQSGWQRNLLHDIIRSRHGRGLPTIITTNLSPEDWADVYGTATGSFINEAFYLIGVKSKAGDLRLKA